MFQVLAHKMREKKKDQNAIIAMKLDMYQETALREIIITNKINQAQQIPVSIVVALDIGRKNALLKRKMMSRQ